MAGEAVVEASEGGGLEGHAKTYEAQFAAQSRIRVTSDVIFSGEGGAQIITANIGEETSESERVYLRRTRSKTSMRSSVFSLSSFTPTIEDSEVEDLLPIPELKANLRRYSKLVLAGYGGASLLFFGVSPMQRYPSQQESSTQDEKTAEETKLATAIDESEAEAAGESTVQNTVEGDIFQQYSWWDILLGKHDQEIFENTLAAHPSEPSKKSKMTALNIKSRAVIGTQHLMPRFWVLTDYHRQEVVLVIRGTMSLNEIAADLTCEPDWFEPAKTPAPTEDDHRVPGQFRFPSKPAERAPGTRYHVHGGMLKLAKAMGDIGKPVQLAVMEALHCNPDFDLVLCGHSLGAGVAALLGMFIAVRKTLEANMQNCDMYPPGRVFWAVRDRDFHPSHQRYQDYAKAKLRLFEVLNVREVFSQIVFAQNMLSSHMPHQYDKVLHELL
ncbi:hypothetical protein H1R20_g14578, partial [Candolleomyces eurysporus]